MNAAAQWTTIWYMMLCGLSMGLVFDFYRVASHRFHVSRWLLPGLDVVFWAAATLGVFSILLGSNHGEVRMYVFLGLGIGVTGYFGLFSPTMVKVAGWIYDQFKRLVLFVWKLLNALVLNPFLFIVRVLAKLMDIAFVVVAAIVLWLSKLIFKLLLKPLFAALGKRIWTMLLPIRKKLAPVLLIFGKIKEKWNRIRDLFCTKK